VTLSRPYNSTQVKHQDSNILSYDGGSQDQKQKNNILQKA